MSHTHYKGHQLIFENFKNKDTYGWLIEQFVVEQYKKLNVAGKQVIDLGAAIGDSAIYFALNGAKNVYAFEVEPQRFASAQMNIKNNHVTNIQLIMGEFNWDFINSIQGTLVMKCDIDGGEVGLFKAATPSQLARLTEIIIEYDDKKVCRELETVFKNAGLKVSSRGTLLHVYSE